MNGGGVFYLSSHDLHTEQLSQEKNNEIIPNGILKNCFEAEFYSTKTFGTFSAYFDEALYHDASSRYKDNVLGAIGKLHMISGIAKVLEDVAISNCNTPNWNSMMRFLEQDFYKVHDDARIYSQVINKFSRYITATIMVRLYQNTNPEALQILSISDSKATSSKLEYHQKDGVCYSIKSYTGSLKIVAKALEDGQVRVYLSAPFVTESGNPSKHIPYYIDYTSLIVNNKVVFNELKPIWHDKSFRYILNNVKAGEEITIQVEWLPHRSDT